MDPHQLFKRYEQLQQYVGWTEEDVQRVREIGPLVEPYFAALVDDFYSEIRRHPQALKVITGGGEQIERLKKTLVQWLGELFSGNYDAEYVHRRWRVGHRHVEIGLDQVYTNAALSRLRTRLLDAMQRRWQGSHEDLLRGRGSLNKLLDLDLVIIEDAYQTEYTIRRETAERLATIGQVAGGVAHELRNPLNVIKTSVYFLLHAGKPSPEKVAEHLRRIEHQVGVADDVITALTRFAKLPLPQQEPLAVDGLLQEAIEGSQVPENVSLVVQCPPHFPAVLADGGQIRIVLRNLIRNACEAMPDGGQLTISASHSKDTIAITVRDTGHGIEPHHLKRITEPLFSTKARGIGLGLAMAKAIVGKNDGSLRVESEPGRGATFTVLLPAGRHN